MHRRQSNLWLFIHFYYSQIYENIYSEFLLFHNDVMMLRL